MSASAELPRYKCHKEVHALKLADIQYNVDESVTLVPADKRFEPIVIEHGKGATRFPTNPKDDPGYLVVYKDGYRSWSPTEAFEEGYARIDGESAVLGEDVTPGALRFVERADPNDPGPIVRNIRILQQLGENGKWADVPLRNEEP